MEAAEQIPTSETSSEVPEATTAEQPEATTAEQSVPAQRILVAEDSPVTQDLLKLVLEQRGHAVDLAADGESALTALEATSYDVVLMDFHLPKVDGLEVATRFRERATNGDIPRFVAITADIKGLLSHTANCENFDEVIPKPFDLEDVLKVVEQVRNEAPEPSRSQDMGSVAEIPTLTGVPAEKARTSGLQALGYEFLRWPEDFNAERLSARGVHASLADGHFDGILLSEPATVRDLSQVWTTKTLHLLPVIDMTGSLPRQTDLDGSRLSVEETDELDRLIRSFHDRRAKLHPDLVYTDDIGEKLIGRMFVSGGALKAGYDPTIREFVGYDAVLDFRSLEKAVRDLVAGGLVDRQFFDRFHYCDRCGSSHFNIREECSECGSADLKEEAYLHHFKCAYQGPESDFRRDDDLVCPKCRQELSHFSVDYDKPGSMMQCQGCGHATSEPAVGFVCMECEAHYDGDSVRMRDAYSYTLLDRGTDFAQAGRALLDGKHATLRFAELPLELIVSMDAELKLYEAKQKPFALLNISYGNAYEIEHKDGLRQFIQSRDFFLENLRNTARKEDCVVKGQNYDFVLLKGSAPEDVRASIDELCKEATASLRVDLGVNIDVFGPEDFA